MDKYRDQAHMEYGFEVVLSQSGLNMLRHYESMFELLFMVPIMEDSIVSHMFLHLEFYVFFF